MLSTAVHAHRDELDPSNRLFAAGVKEPWKTGSTLWISSRYILGMGARSVARALVHSYMTGMIQPSINLRPAKPTLDEGLVYARYLDVAAEGFLRFMLGRRATEIIGKAYLQTGSNYSYENVLFAERDHRIVGMASGFTAEQHRSFTDRPLKQAAGFQAVRMMLVKTLFAPMMRILNTIEEGEFYLLSLAIDEELRGAGIGSALIDAMEVRAVASGSVRFALDVAASNAGARRLYERRGMAVESQWPRRLNIPRLKFYRMTKTLGVSEGS